MNKGKILTSYLKRRTKFNWEEFMKRNEGGIRYKEIPMKVEPAIHKFLNESVNGGDCFRSLVYFESVTRNDVYSDYFKCYSK